MLTYTLLTDGSSDRTLIPILTWLLEQQGVRDAIQSLWADLRPLRNKPRSLSKKIEQAVYLFPCDLLFIHRDAENQPSARRLQEINDAIQNLHESISCPPAICVIPIRMQEAWLLFNESAIRLAAGNPNGHVQLDLPDLHYLEQLVDPKDVLYELLRAASGLSGRRRRNFEVDKAASRVADYIDDFSALRRLSAFYALETEISQLVRNQSWNQ